ncbi:MAG: hypothetical protein LBL13_08370 [Bacteroidales bacterium]|jgi:uncharacterized membrane protein|nr:hypothetical protein [Bacteroidales bacterium]
MSTSESKNDIYTSFIKDVKEYMKMNYDLFCLHLIEKLSIILSFLFALFIGVLLLMVAFVYFSMAFIYWTELFFHSLIPGFLILGGVYVGLFFVFYLFRKRIFVNPLIKILSRILFREHKKAIKNEEE